MSSRDEPRRPTPPTEHIGSPPTEPLRPDSASSRPDGLSDDASTGGHGSGSGKGGKWTAPDPYGVRAGTGKVFRLLGRGTVGGAKLAGRGGRAGALKARAYARSSGADESGLARLVELHFVNIMGDAALTVSLAGTIFAIPTDEARAQVAQFLLLTMAPFALLAPFIGPLLDRFRHGRRWAIGSTLALRAFLCWVLAGAVVTDSPWLFPAALGCLVAAKAYGVTRAAAIPRLLPPGFTLVNANSRIALAGVAAMGIGGGIAGALSRIGPDWSLRLAFAIYVVGTVLAIRLPARVDSAVGERDIEETQNAPPLLSDTAHPADLVPEDDGWRRDGVPEDGGWRRDGVPEDDGVHRDVVPDSDTHRSDVVWDRDRPDDLGEWTRADTEPVDTSSAARTTDPDGPLGAVPQPTGSHPTGSQPTAHPAPESDTGVPGEPRRADEPAETSTPSPATRHITGLWPRLKARILALPASVRAALVTAMGGRLLTGFLTLFMAFLMREHPITGYSGPLILALVVGAAGAGNALGTVVGNAARKYPPDRIASVAFLVIVAVALSTALFYGLWTLLLIGLCAGMGAQVIKLSTDAIIQRDVAENVRTQTFAWSETVLQIAWVIGGGLGISLPLNPQVGFGVISALLVMVLLVSITLRRSQAGSRPAARPR